MRGPEHRLEKRARRMSEMLTQRVAMVRDQIAPPGARPPFYTQKSEKDAVAWWRQHRFDELGQAVLEHWRPEDILDLDARLSRAIEQEQVGGLGDATF